MPRSHAHDRAGRGHLRTDRAARVDPDPVLALRRGQDHADPGDRAGSGLGARPVDLGDDPGRAAPPRSTGGTTTSSTARPSRTCAAATTCSNGPRSTAISTARLAGPVEKVLGAGRDMIFDIDYQGTRQVRAKLAQDVVTVFILPPSMAELRQRLERRAEDSPETIEKRLANARTEIQRWSRVRLRHRQRRPAERLPVPPGHPGRRAAEARPPDRPGRIRRRAAGRDALRSDRRGAGLRAAARRPVHRAA